MKKDESFEQQEMGKAALNRLSALFNQSEVSHSTVAQHHWKCAQQCGFPTTQHEDWQYTPLLPLLKTIFTIAPAGEIDVDIDVVRSMAMLKDAYLIVMINGYFCEKCSDTDLGPYEFIEERGAVTPLQPEIFLHITESFAPQPLTLRLSANQKPEKPLYLLYINSAPALHSAASLCCYRIHLIIESGAAAEVIEHFSSLSAPAQCNEKSELTAHFIGTRLTTDIENSGRLTHTKIAQEHKKSYHLAHNDFMLAQGAVATSNMFLFGAELMRHQTSVGLVASHADITLNSLIFPLEGEVADMRSYIEHNAADGCSRQLHKMIVAQQSKAVFNGMIKVAKGAIKTDGQMMNKTLLLDESAAIHTKPQLEIYADDVKCGHGATVGSLDEAALFYLQARGFSKQQAQTLITEAFAGEIIEQVLHLPLQQALLQHLSDRLAIV